MSAPLPSPRYSVVVPAYNASSTIAACLDALLAQSVPPDAYEIVVVDDGSTDDTAAVASRYPVRLLRQAHAGPASARNLGARSARGEYLLFTDADCAPVSDWIAEVVRPLEADPGVAAAKGAYRTRQTSLIARLAQAELEEKYARLRRLGSIDFVDTYSAAFRRDAFWEAGGFDSAFRAASNEDTQLSFELVSRGWRLAFAERAVVHHRHAESLGRYLLRKYRHGYWRARVYRRHPGKMAGDSYTPRCTQLQFLAAVATPVLLALPQARPFGVAAAALFLLATIPFVRRAWPFGPAVAAAMPPVLLLRSLALGAGLLLGALALAGDGMRARLAGRR